MSSASLVKINDHVPIRTSRDQKPLGVGHPGCVVGFAVGIHEQKPDCRSFGLVATGKLVRESCVFLRLFPNRYREFQFLVMRCSHWEAVLSFPVLVG
ncbi:MAG: hypothetical protein MK161_06570 [Pirellulales bacterium]|nr:hypothetical protein [Pirellulales bacterium]